MALRMHNTNTFMNYSPTWRVETLLNVIRSRKRVLSEISSSGCRCRCIKILPHSFALVTGFLRNGFCKVVCFMVMAFLYASCSGIPF